MSTGSRVAITLSFSSFQPSIPAYVQWFLDAISSADPEGINAAIDALRPFLKTDASTALLASAKAAQASAKKAVHTGSP